MTALGPLAGVVGGLTIIIGSLLPWVTVSSGFGSFSAAGTEGDGQITLALGAITIIVALGKFARAGRTTALNVLLLLCGLVALGIAIYDIGNVGSAMSDTVAFARGSVGVGLYIVVLGGFVTLFGAAGQGGRVVSSTATVGTRECPHCKEAMRRDASVCPHCQRDSQPWVLHQGRWWHKGSDGIDYYLDEQKKQWVASRSEPPDTSTSATS